MNNLIGKRYLFFILLSLLVAGMAWAQETTGSVRGTVTDPSGAAIPGARLELAGGAVRFTTTTEADGSFRFAQVPAGTGYTVSVMATGFRNARVANVVVELGKATSLEVKLEVGQLSESVTVAADAVIVDTQSSASAVTVDKSFFDNLPKGRSFYDLVAIAPGARNESKSGGYAIDGASGSENTYYLDGMEVTNVQTGILSDQNKVPVEMVQQVEVKNGVMEAQYGGALGGVVNAVVRSGSGEFHGEAGFYFNNDALRARERPDLMLDRFDETESRAEYFQGRQDAFRTWNPVFSLGGPLVKNKLFFFSSYAPTFENRDRTVDFVTGDIGSYNRKYTQQYLANKVDFMPFSKLRLNTSWIWNPEKYQGVLPVRAGTDSFDNNWGEQGNYRAGNILSGAVDYIASSRLVLSFRGGYSYTNYNNNYSIPQRTAIYYSPGNTDPLLFPGIPSSLRAPAGWVSQAVGFTKYDTYIRKNYNADVSYVFNLAGQHNLKGGWQRNDLSNDVFNTSYPNGYFRYYWNQEWPCVTSQCTTGKGAYGFYRYRVLGTIGKASSNNQGLFAQDNWRVNRRLTLNIGLRTEREYVPVFSLDGKSSGKPIEFSWSDKLSPRLGFALDLKGDGKQRLYGSWGRFFDIMKYEMPRGSFGGDVWKEWYYTLEDPNVVTQMNAYPSDPYKLPGKFLEMVDWRIPSNDPAMGLLDPNLKPVENRMFDLGYDHTISPTVVASVRYTNRRLVRTIEDTGFMGADGETYLIANPGEGITADKAFWNRIWQGVDLPIPPKPVRKYDAVEFRLDKRMSARYQFTASYTYSYLRGNYSGLASSDEDGRNSPNVNRYYDMPWVGIDQNGKYTQGRLPTDRPHTFKFFGGYMLPSRLGQTTFSPIVSWYSGTPVTSEAQIISTTNIFPYGRGDLGRTPMYFNADFNVQHEFAPFKSNESRRIRFEFSVFNLFNSSTVTGWYKQMIHPTDSHVQFGENNDDYAAPFRGFDLLSMMQQQGVRQDPQYKLPNSFQGPRYARLHVTFIF